MISSANSKMSLATGVAVLAVLLCAVHAADITLSDKTCQIPIGSKEYKNRKNWPLVFRPDGTLYRVVKDIDGTEVVSVPKGENVLLSCGPNYMAKKYKTEFIDAVCLGGGRFKSGGEEFGLKEITCDLRVIEEVYATVTGCPAGYNSTKFGYVHPTEKKTHVIGEACYDTVVGRTLFAHVALGRETDSLQLGDSNFLLGKHPPSDYKLDFFKTLKFDKFYEKIRKTLGIVQAPEFSLEHLINADLLTSAQFLGVEKLSWNYALVRDDLEVWRSLTKDIGKHGKSTELDIYTGTNGTLRLRSPSSQLDLYLQDAREDMQIPNRFPIPDMIWTLVKSKENSVVFFVFHDSEYSAEKSQLCKSVCHRISWLEKVNRLSVGSRKSLLCCNLQDVKDTFRGFGIDFY